MTKEKFKKAKQCLTDNGIDPDETEIVLQALCYILLDEETEQYFRKELKIMFDIKNYKGKYAMHCKTPEEAREFCKYLHRLGKRWCTGDSYLFMSQWYTHTQDTVYFFNTDMHGSLQYAQENGFTILEWADYMN